MDVAPHGSLDLGVAALHLEELVHLLPEAVDAVLLEAHHLAAEQGGHEDHELAQVGNLALDLET